jgi:hypothetical protein
MNEGGNIAKTCVSLVTTKKNKRKKKKLEKRETYIRICEEHMYRSSFGRWRLGEVTALVDEVGSPYVDTPRNGREYNLTRRKYYTVISSTGYIPAGYFVDCSIIQDQLN